MNRTAAGALAAAAAPALLTSACRARPGRVNATIERFEEAHPAAWTLSYGLESVKGAHHTDWNLTMAATALVVAPVILVSFLARKAVIEGVTLTGVKG